MKSLELFSVTLIFSADFGVDVQASSPEEAAEMAYASDEASVSLCNQCAGHVNVEDCVRVIVYDKDGNEVFDDGRERRQIVALQARVAELEAKLAAVGKA